MLKEDIERNEREASIIRSKKGPDNSRINAEIGRAKSLSSTLQNWANQQLGIKRRKQAEKERAAAESWADFSARKSAGIAEINNRERFGKSVIEKRENYGRSKKR